MIKLKDLVESMNDISLMFEMPMKISSMNIGRFYEPTDNYQYAKKTREFGKKVGDFKESEIFRIKSSEVYSDIFIVGEFVVAYFEYEISQDDFVLERKVWQDQTHLGLSRNIVFDYYLKNHRGMVSDGLHTDLGELYWKKIVRDALKGGFKVYAVKTPSTKISITSSDEMDKFYKSASYRFAVERI